MKFAFALASFAMLAACSVLQARRIASNFQILALQESFSQPSRQSFALLGLRWQATAARLAPPGRPEGGHGLAETLLALRQQRL